MTVLSSIGGHVLLIAGRLLARIQRLVGAEARARGLTEAERERLSAVFRESVALDDVRVVEGRSGLFGVNDRPFTLGSTIYLKGVDLTTRFDVLVHECVHVWQYQHIGARYAADALAAQVRYGWRRRGAYDWRAELERGHARWSDFNAEAQGSFIQARWQQGGSGLFESDATSGFVVDGTDYTEVAVDALLTMRRPTGRQSRSRRLPRSA